MQQRALARPAGTDNRYHLATSHTEIHAVEHGNQPAVATGEGLSQVNCFQYGHSCRIASTGNNLAAWRAGYSVASAAIARLATTMNATSRACVATGR